MEFAYHEKRYQVFVSSTFRDLKEERNSVIKALLDIDMFPAAMEHFPASDDDPTSYIKSLMSSCDYYILILGGKYGSLTSEGISYTRLEYQMALDLGIPVISFIHEDISALPSRDVELEGEKKEKFNDFLKLVKKRLFNQWANADQLHGLVIASLLKLTKTKPGTGWIKANSITKEHTGLLRDIKKEKEENTELREKLEGLQKISPIEAYIDFDEAWPTLSDLLLREIKSKMSQGEKLKIRCMGLCLHKSFPKLKSFLLNKDNDISNLRIEIRLSILDVNCDSWKKLDSQWEGLMNAFNSQLDDFIKRIKAKSDIDMSLKLTKYRHMPNFHGIMVNKHDLFLSGCMWDSHGNLTAGQNAYEYYKSGMSEHHDHMLRLYSRWFDFGRYQDQQKETLVFDTRNW